MHTPAINHTLDKQARGLAERVSGEPPTIRLRFQHRDSDQVAAVDAFYMTSKANHCVACGEEGHYLRFKVRAVKSAQSLHNEQHDLIGCPCSLLITESVTVSTFCMCSPGRRQFQ